ncbi:MAG: hypothetical protein O3C60_13280 [Planctomycetota bacterium]|nr:hypothetical protein [Planctomycetota bacterium]
MTSLQSRTQIVLMLCATLTMSAVRLTAAENGLLADYSFQDGEGSQLRDRSGAGRDGTIYSPAWINVGKVHALEFAGRASWVDLPGIRQVDLEHGYTLLAWIYVEPQPSVMITPLILGNSVCSFQQNRMELSAGGMPSGQLRSRRWTHVAVTFDGAIQRVYADGQFRAAVRIEKEKLPSDWGTFRIAPETAIGRWDPAPDFGPRFRGKLAGLTIYQRSLSLEEVGNEFRNSFRTGTVVPACLPLPSRGKVWVELDAARLGVPLSGLSVTAAIYTPGTLTPLTPLTPPAQLNEWGRGIVEIDASSLPSGRYAVRAGGVDSSHQPIELSDEETFEWTTPSHFPSAANGTKKLNNFVTELLHVPTAAANITPKFTNFRNGWVYIANRADRDCTLTRESDGLSVSFPLSEDYEGSHESMRWLAMGTYQVAVPQVQDLIVRAVPELIYDCTPGTPTISGFGPYDDAFESTYVFPHANTLVVVADYDRPVLKEWKSKGRRLLRNQSAEIYAKPDESKEEWVFKTLTTCPGFVEPLFDGVLSDEFAGSDQKVGAWARAMDRALSDPRFAGKVFHAYNYAPYDSVARGDEGRALSLAVQKHDMAVVWECYVKDRRSELEALWGMRDKMIGESQEIVRTLPKSMEHLIVAPYAYVQGGPPWTTATVPSANWKTALDLQFQLLAVDPTFMNAKGLMTYRATYADEEMVRWGARLFRHYGIEGKTNRCGSDPYELTHIKDPDFEYQGKHWKLQPAEPNSIRFDVSNRMPLLQGRYNDVAEGTTVLVTKRSVNQPNVFSQEITGLRAGELYSLRLHVADFQDSSPRSLHEIRIAIDGAEFVPERSFTHIGTSEDRKGWGNWHVRIFRAPGETARISVSDWAESQSAGSAPIGQELMFNYIKVQPYRSRTDKD